MRIERTLSEGTFFWAKVVNNVDKDRGKLIHPKGVRVKRKRQGKGWEQAEHEWSYQQKMEK